MQLLNMANPFFRRRCRRRVELRAKMYIQSGHDNLGTGLQDRVSQDHSYSQTVWWTEALESSRVSRVFHNSVTQTMSRFRF